MTQNVTIAVTIHKTVHPPEFWEEVVCKALAKGTHLDQRDLGTVRVLDEAATLERGAVIGLQSLILTFQTLFHRSEKLTVEEVCQYLKGCVDSAPGAASGS